MEAQYIHWSEGKQSLQLQLKFKPNAFGSKRPTSIPNALSRKQPESFVTQVIEYWGYDSATVTKSNSTCRLFSVSIFYVVYMNCVSLLRQWNRMMSVYFRLLIQISLREINNLLAVWHQLQLHGNNKIQHGMVNWIIWVYSVQWNCRAVVSVYYCWPQYWIMLMRL